MNINRNSKQHLAIFEELFLSCTYNLKLVTFVPDLVLDIGAHIGLFSLLASSEWPNSQIVAVEPDPENAMWARSNIAVNCLRVATLEAAASDKSGWMKFNSGDGMGNLSETGDQTVRVVNLPALIKAIPSKATLLKMDIEGEELNLLPCVLPLLPDICAVYVELHGTNQQLHDLLVKINLLGFFSLELNRKSSDCGVYYYVDYYLTRQS